MMYWQEKQIKLIEEIILKDIPKDINFINYNILKQLNYLQIKDYYFIHIQKINGTSIINQFFKLC